MMSMPCTRLVASQHLNISMPKHSLPPCTKPCPKNRHRQKALSTCDTAMECVALDSSNSPPPPKDKRESGAISSSSSSSSSVEGSLTQYTSSVAAGSGSSIKMRESYSDSVSSSSSSSRDSGFLSKYVSSAATVLHSSLPTSVAVSAAADASIARKEPKSSHRTIRYFDEADASIT
jgi:hypothetical protein